MIGRLSAAALLSVVLAGCGGTEVRGVVRDQDSGQPLQGAVVQVDDQSTRTDPGGFYKLEIDIEDDEPAQFMVNAPGYEQKSILANFDEDQDTVYSDIELKKEFSEKEYRREQLDIQNDQLQRQQQELMHQQQELQWQQQQLKRQQQQQEQLDQQQQHQQQQPMEQEKPAGQVGETESESFTPEESIEGE